MYARAIVPGYVKPGDLFVEYSPYVVLHESEEMLSHDVLSALFKQWRTRCPRAEYPDDFFFYLKEEIGYKCPNIVGNHIFVMPDEGE